MEQWSVADEDRPPYLRASRRPYYAWLVAALAAVLLASAAAYYWTYLPRGEPLPSGAQAPIETAAPAAPVAPPQPAPAAAAPTLGEPAPALPALEHSDSMIRQSIAGLVGEKAFDAYVIPEQLVRRIVATVDNLPRATAPTRTLPLNAVPGAFATAGSDQDLSIDAANAARYAPYVRVFDSIDAHALVQSYARAYPLFQRAYEELGFPGKVFNDRLLEAIDDLLAAPELDTPVKLMRPRVLYEFTDPDLETRSAGEKILMRMGKENELAVKAKLREIRREILAARSPRR